MTTGERLAEEKRWHEEGGKRWCKDYTWFFPAVPYFCVYCILLSTAGCLILSYICVTIGEEYFTGNLLPSIKDKKFPKEIRKYIYKSIKSKMLLKRKISIAFFSLPNWEHVKVSNKLP